MVRHAEGAHLAGALELIERGRDLLWLDKRVGAVQHEHVEVVGSECGERLLGAPHDVLSREIEAGFAWPDAALRLQHDLARARPA